MGDGHPIQRIGLRLVAAVERRDQLEHRTHPLPFAVYVAWDDGGHLNVYADLDEMEGNVAPSIFDSAKAALTGQPMIIERDI